MRIEWHHVVPKSDGGRDTAPLHPICHRIVHAAAANAELARLGTLEALRTLAPIARFLAWIADKPPDFHAPTRRARPTTAAAPGVGDETNPAPCGFPSYILGE